jgi:hypothetical protein
MILLREGLILGLNMRMVHGELNIMQVILIKPKKNTTEKDFTQVLCIMFRKNGKKKCNNYFNIFSIAALTDGKGNEPTIFSICFSICALQRFPIDPSCV